MSSRIEGKNLLRADFVLLVVAVAGLLMLLFLIISGPHRLVYDEEGNLTNVSEVQRIGWAPMLTSPRSLSSAGPLYTAIQVICEPFTKIQAPSIRYPNYGLLLGLLAVTYGAAKLLGLNRAPLVAFSLLFIPFLWSTVGLALTELPALFCFTVAMWLCFFLPQEDLSLSLRLIAAVVAGLFLGLACLGRQVYLVVILFLPFLCTQRRETWLAVGAAMVTALGVSSWLFWVWRGLVPPHLGHIDSGLQWSHAILSFAYAGLATLFISPLWLTHLSGLQRRAQILVVSVCGAAALIALLFPFAEITPAKTLMQRIMPATVFGLYPRVMLAVMTAIAVVWLIRLVFDVWLFRNDNCYLFMSLTLVALALTPVKISHQFSSRYVVALITPLVLVVWRSAPVVGWSNVVAGIAGVIIGASVLTTYFQ